jgi:hypothetical protein
VHLWDAATGKELRRLKHEVTGEAVAFSPDGRVLASAGIGDAIRLWDAATGELLYLLVRKETGRTRRAFQLAFSPDSRTLISAEIDGVLLLWEVATGQLRRELAGHSGSVYAVAAFNDCRRLVSAGSDTTALVWELTGRPPENLEVAWDKLKGPNAAEAYQAILDLTAAGKPAVALLAMHLKPVPAAEPAQIARLVADLESETFATRAQAQAELEKFAEGAEPALRKALEGNPSLKRRRRLEGLLAYYSATRLPNGRALEVLERMGNREARELMEPLAGGSSQAWLTKEAKAALDRLARRQRAGP